MNTRLRAQQSWPALEKTALTALGMARARSASAKMTFGDFPPSSREMRVIVSAAAFMISMPVLVSPVNAIFPTPGWRTRAMPAVAPGPVTTFRAPAGTPASNAIMPSASAVSAVALAGLSPAVLPTANAGAPFQEPVTRSFLRGRDGGHRFRRGRAGHDRDSPRGGGDLMPINNQLVGLRCDSHGLSSFRYSGVT